MSWEWPEKDGKPINVERNPRRMKIVAWAIFGLVFFVLLFPLFEEWKKPPQQRAAEGAAAVAADKAREVQKAADRYAEQTRREQLRVMCAIAPVCEKWAKTRQECATAGNFETCLSVRMGDEYPAVAFKCTTSGEPVQGWKPPGTGECMMLKLGLK